MQRLKASRSRTDGDGIWKLLGAGFLIVLGLAAELLVAWPAAFSGAAAPARTAVLGLNAVVLVAVVYLLWSAYASRQNARALRDEALSTMSRRLELALEVSQIGFWDVDLESDMLRWDARACQHMGVPYRDGFFTEADWLGAVHPEDRGRAVAAAEVAVETGGRFISDYRVVWPSGEVRHIRDMAAYYLGADGRPRITGVLWDVTADKQREAELEVRRRQAEAADKAKSSFLAAMSHEIRTPLGGVIGMLDLMQSDGLAGEQAERARIASASAQSLLQLLNDVLDVSKLEAASMALSPVPVDIRRLVTEVSDLMAARAAQKGLAFTCQVDDSVAEWLSVDPVRFRQVLTNIVSNAIAYTDEGAVEVRVRHSEKTDRTGLEVAVEDTGIGIADTDCGRIFDRFVQTDASTKRQSGGTGLGLAIARELVELMGGRITVESTLGAGSIFTFSVRAEPCDAPEGQAPASGAPSGTPLDVLVAEDNATNRFLINSLLRRGGHRVTLVENGREAVESVRTGRYDVVLMDVQMPVMDGLAAAQAIRALEPPANLVPIVALTASVLADDRARYIEAGMDECLAKPIDIAALNAVLSKPVTAQTSAPPIAVSL